MVWTELKRYFQFYFPDWIFSLVSDLSDQFQLAKFTPVLNRGMPVIINWSPWLIVLSGTSLALQMLWHSAGVSGHQSLGVCYIQAQGIWQIQYKGSRRSSTEDPVDPVQGIS